MITSEENQLLTQTHRGAPAGELLRRYWQPVALVEELPAIRDASDFWEFTVRTAAPI
jgi:hypothetical protein